MRPSTSLTTAALLALMLAACGSDEQEPSGADEAAGPSVTVSTASSDALSPGDRVTLEVDVSGFELDPDAIGGDNAAGRGHYHVYWDDTGGEPAAVAAGARAEVTVPADAVDGKHELIVSLRNNDHTPLEPPTQTGTAVTVSGGAARPAVSWTADNVTALQAGDTITLTIEVENFTLDGNAIGGANADGVGHYHVYWDGASGDDYLAMGADAAIEVQVPEDATDGSHKVTVSLRNNDHSPLSPPVEAEDWVLVYRLD